MGTLKWKEKLKVDSTAKSSILNLLLRPVGMLLGVLYTPLLLDYLGDEANGVWATVLSIITWINYCDLGIGNGLRNLLAKELAREDYENAQKSVSTAYVVLTGIASILLIVLTVLVLVLNWNSILNTELVVRPMILITEVYIVVNFVLALSNSILYAMQKSEWVSLRSCFVQVINIVGLLLLRGVEEGNLTHMAILFGSSTAAVYIYNTVNVIRKKRYLMPKLKMFSKDKVADITSSGLQFFVIQLTAVVILSSQNLLAANWFGAAAVTPFNTVNAAFAALYSAMAALVTPMWSRATEAIEKKEFKWLRAAMRKVRHISYLFIFVLILFAVVYEEVAYLWLGRRLEYQRGVIPVTCLFYVLETLNLMFTQFYYGMGEIRPYMWLTVVQAVTIVPLGFWLSKTLGFGVMGVKLAAAIILGVSGVALPVLTYKRIRALEKNSVV